MIISQTPLRISFLGGGTDFKDYYKDHEGAVLSCTIDKYLYVIVKERFDSLIYINYSKKEIIDSVYKIQHELVKEAMMITGVKNGIEITIMADIPSEGSGLGSSSSLLVGLLNALYMYKGKQVTAEQLADEACRIEIQKCKKPIGKQDQYIAAYGGICAFNFLKNGKVRVKKIKIDEIVYNDLSSNIMLFFTGKTRKSSDVLSEQKSNIRAKISELNAIKKLAQKAETAFETNKFSELGKLLHSNWTLKKKLSSNISNREIDEMYQCALDAGALGGKIAGAGGGGFLLLYCEKNNQDRVRKALKNFKELFFNIEMDGSKIIFNYRRNKWS